MRCIERAADQLMGSRAYLRDLPLVLVDGNSIVWRSVLAEWGFITFVSLLV